MAILKPSAALQQLGFSSLLQPAPTSFPMDLHPTRLAVVQGEAEFQPGMLRFMYLLSLGQICSSYGRSHVQSEVLYPFESCLLPS